MTKSDDKKVPALRFEGFTDDWEQRKFESLIYPEKIKNKNNLQLPAYSISNKNGFIAQTDQFGKDNTYSKTDKKTNYIVNPRTFAYNPARINVGSIGYQNLATPVLVSSLYEVFKTNSQINDLFLIYWFKTDKFFNQIKKYEEGGVRQYYFLDKLLFSKIIIPKDIKEQKKISEILKKLDCLISLQQRKLEQIKLLKKAMLQGMFIDENYPQIRFKKFKEAWRQFKLGEIGRIQSGIGFPDKEQGGKKGIPFFKVSDMNSKGNEFEMVTSNNYVSEKQINAKKWKPIVKVPATIFAKVGAALMLNRKRLVTIPFLIDNNTMAYIFNEEWDPYFGKTLFDTLNLPKYAQTGALPSFNRSDIENIRVMIPKSAEQFSISQYFKIIDAHIALQQSQVSRLKKLKKFLLQNMFI